MTSKQLAEWEAYDRLEPIGDWRGDYRMSFIVSTLWNIVVRLYGRKDAKLTKPKDFYPRWDMTEKEIQEERQREKAKKQSPEEMKKILQSLFRINKRKGKAKKSKKSKKQ